MTAGYAKDTQQRPPSAAVRRGQQPPLHFIIVYTNLIRHRKLTALSISLAISDTEAIGILVRLWSECGERAADGDLSRYTALQIAAACGWPVKQARRLVDALVSAGFLDRDRRGGLQVHNWGIYTGRAVRHRQANAERVARFRHRQRYRNGNVRITSPLRNATDKSRAEQRREEKKRKEQSKSRSARLFSHSLNDQNPKPQPPSAGDATLLRQYHEQAGVHPSPTDAQFLETLARRHGGPTAVAQVLEEIGPRLRGTRNPRRYLEGGLRRAEAEGRLRRIGMPPPPDDEPPRTRVRYDRCAGVGCPNVVEVPEDAPDDPVYCRACPPEAGR
jgi:hypothetical protein